MAARKKRKRDIAATPTIPVRDAPLAAPVWGRELIDDAAVKQLENAMRLPVAVAGALLPDAHVGYGIPIGGVVALEDAVAPYMVGVDIACRMMMSIYAADDLDLLENASRRDMLKRALRDQTRFGIGAGFQGRERRDHDVMDDADWDALPLLRHLKDRAWEQLGSSGSGNHFVDAGVLEVGLDASGLELEPGRYLAVMSHSGSRGAGSRVADHFSRLAREAVPLPPELQHLAWLPLSSEAGQEYWLAMNLMGRYASANHHTMHRAIARALGLKPLAQLENHHNFAWREQWGGRDVYVHRKGATPAHAGELGIIPGSQGHDSFIVRGRGSEASLNSASHGAGRVMSRKQAKQSIPKRDRDRWLAERDVELMDAGMDEAPQAYKDIRQVLACQADLIDPIATFRPRIVLMAAGGPAED
ncbi:MAG TPA: RtcB family protein [Longimicrobiales bacterium]|nr:RtcB family protein [Longimicrobiales bacterium]